MAAESGIDEIKLSAEVARRAIDQISVFAEEKVKEKWTQHKDKNIALFASYIQAQAKRCALVRTLVYDKQSAYLADIYVPLRARMLVGVGRKSGFEELTTEDMIILLGKERDQKKSERKTVAAALSAAAGAGKTFFMKNLYIKVVASSLSKVPIFLDARDLNTIPLTDFAGIITAAFRLAGQQLSPEQAVDGLKAGIFLILIDGFDELRLSHERHYAHALEQAAEEFQLCPLLVSGRPSELLYTFSYFQQCDLLPLDHKEAVELIRRLDFDETTKSSFIALMQRELFGSHAGFLALPLLCVVMLLTYSDAGRISHKEHEFYEDAFNALCNAGRGVEFSFDARQETDRYFRNPR